MAHFTYTYLISLLVALLPVLVQTRDVPPNVRAFYNRIKYGKCTGGTILKDGFYSEYPGPKTYAYCQDNNTGVLYLHGPGAHFANMDVDCDGLQSGPVDGRCNSSTDTQSETAFRSTVQEYSKEYLGKEVEDLNANFIPYVVFGNYGSEKNYTTFHPTNYGVKPLSVMGVVCGEKLIYGVWGDENGDDGKSVVGEASLSLATACFGDHVNGNLGHSAADVLYIAFPGSINQTVEKAANWSAQRYEDFESTILAKGNKLIEVFK